MGPRERLAGVVVVPLKEGVSREAYVLDSREFMPVMVVRRIYRVSSGRGRRRGGVREAGLGVEDEGIGIGGYVVRFADGHECSVLTLSLFL